MNPLAFLAGAGDVAQRRIEREHQNAVQEQVRAHTDKLAIAAQFEQLGVDPNFPAEGRMAAFQWRQRILSDPKIKPKDIDAGFADVFARTRRTVSGAAERNAQRSTVPALSALDELLGTNASGDEQPQPLPSRPSADEGMSGAPPTATAPDRRPFDYIAPGLHEAVGAARNQFSMLGPDAEPTSVTGWFTPGEQAEKAVAQLKAYRGAMGGDSGESGSDFSFAPTWSAKGGISVKPMVGRNLPYAGDLGDGKIVPLTYDMHGGVYKTLDGKVVQPRQVFTAADRPQVFDTVDENGNRVASVRPLRGQMETGVPVAKPTKNEVRITHGPNGEEVATFVQPGYNGAPGVIAGQQQVGTQPFSTLRIATMAKTLAGKGLDNMTKEYKLRGSITLPDGSEYVPNGTVQDAWGASIAPIAGSHAYPTAAAVTRATVARDAIAQIDDVATRAKALETKFGPIQGRFEDWVAKHKLYGDPDVAGLQLSLTHLSAMAPAIHQFRNAQFSERFDTAMGALGQEYTMFKAKIGAFRDFSALVERGGQSTPLKTQRTTAPPVLVSPRKGGSTPQPSPRKPAAGPPTPSASSVDLSKLSTEDLVRMAAGGQ